MFSIFLISRSKRYGSFVSGFFRSTLCLCVYQCCFLNMCFVQYLFEYTTISLFILFLKDVYIFMSLGLLQLVLQTHFNGYICEFLRCVYLRIYIHVCICMYIHNIFTLNLLCFGAPVYLSQLNIGGFWFQLRS